jgi:hypothetical protein
LELCSLSSKNRQAPEINFCNLSLEGVWETCLSLKRETGTLNLQIFTFLAQKRNAICNIFKRDKVGKQYYNICDNK